MASDTDPWSEVYEIVKGHRKAQESQTQTIERIAAKCLRVRLDSPLNATTCSISKKSLKPADLVNLVRYHGRIAPVGPDLPIVIVCHAGKNVVIDGNTRVSRWLATNQPGPFEAYLISPKP